MVNRKIWQFAEVGLKEFKSSGLLMEQLKKGGFKIKKGISGMPTAFVATYGSGKPVIGILAEYDALPGMSQQVSPDRKPVKTGAAGHACGHSGLGTGAIGAALAAKAAMEKHKLKGTIRLYGTPAEETGIGKVYMTLGGVFDDLDICLHWHPSSRNEAWAASCKAMISAKFSFAGTSAHAAGNPESGRSALDGVELMNIGANYMREHLKEDARLHYVITNGGGAPNVVPAKSTVWYFCRADKHEYAEYVFKWLKDVAKGAAKMSRTKLTIKVDTDCHEIIPNMSLAKIITDNMVKIGAPTFNDKEKLFARRLQQPLIKEFRSTFPMAIDHRIHRGYLQQRPSKGSTDVGDISWRIPTGGLRTASMVANCPGHSWQAVASIGSTIGEKGILFGAKSLAVTAVELLQDPRKVAAAKAEFKSRMKGRKYFTFVPKGQKPPQKIR